MSYSESNGQVILTMSKEDYELLTRMLGAGSIAVPFDRSLPFLTRLNSGNPNYPPYQVEAKK
ncbi:MAG: hypothetical protein ACRD20_20615 [Terriglobales bacterium]